MKKFPFNHLKPYLNLKNLTTLKDEIPKCPDGRPKNGLSSRRKSSAAFKIGDKYKNYPSNHAGVYSALFAKKNRNFPIKCRLKTNECGQLVPELYVSPGPCDPGSKGAKRAPMDDAHSKPKPSINQRNCNHNVKDFFNESSSSFNNTKQFTTKIDHRAFATDKVTLNCQVEQRRCQDMVKKRSKTRAKAFRGEFLIPLVGGGLDVDDKPKDADGDVAAKKPKKPTSKKTRRLRRSVTYAPAHQKTFKDPCGILAANFVSADHAVATSSAPDLKRTSKAARKPPPPALRASSKKIAAAGAWSNDWRLIFDGKQPVMKAPLLVATPVAQLRGERAFASRSDVKKARGKKLKEEATRSSQSLISSSMANVNEHWFQLPYGHLVHLLNRSSLKDDEPSRRAKHDDAKSRCRNEKKDRDAGADYPPRADRDDDDVVTPQTARKWSALDCGRDAATAAADACPMTNAELRARVPRHGPTYAAGLNRSNLEECRERASRRRRGRRRGADDCD